MKHDAPAEAIKNVSPEWRVGIVAATFYKEEIMPMVESAKKTLLDAGIDPQNISFHPVPGSFEIPLIGSALVHAKKVDALIGLGIIVQGETKHADLLAQEVARGMMDIQVRERIPFAFEVLWVSDLALARARINKGEEAARSVLISLAELARLHS